MWKLSATAVLAIALCGCGDRYEEPRLVPLARGFAEAWQPAPLPLSLEIRSENNGEQVIMHLFLRNTSNKTLEVDASTLPWNNADLFSISAVTADGILLKQPKVQPPAMIIRLSIPPKPVDIVSGGTIEGHAGLAFMPMRNVPREQDLLLLWSYRELKSWNSSETYVLSGTTILNAESKKPPVAPISSPGSTVGVPALANEASLSYRTRLRSQYRTFAIVGIGSTG